MSEDKKRDPYAVLGVDKNATEAEIKKAYRQLAVKYHPDKNSGDKDMEEKFKELSESYEILSNPEKKRNFDQFGHDGLKAGAGFGNGSNSSSMQADMMEELFRKMGGHGPFGGRRGNSQQNSIRRGGDLRVKVELDIFEIITGVHKKISITRNVNCDSCHGSGAKTAEDIENCSTCGGSGMETRHFQTNMGIMMQQGTCSKCGGAGKSIKHKCGTCHGSGLVSKKENIEFDIPAGATEGTGLNINSIGNESKGNGNLYNGNLIVEITEKEHEILKRSGNDIISDVFVSYLDAVVGNDELEIDTVDGKVKIKIEPGTESGKTLRLKNKGIPNVNHPSSRGNHLVYVNIFVPKLLSEEELKTMMKLKEIENVIAPDEKKVKHIKGIYSKIKEYDELF